MTNKTYSFKQKDFKDLKGYAGAGIMDYFISDELVPRYIPEYWEATSEEKADLKSQLFQEIARQENKSAEEVKAHYEELNRESWKNYEKEMEGIM